MPWPRRLPARHGSGAASICILACRKQPREAALHSKSCMQGFPVTSGAFVRNNSTLRQCRKLHWLPYFPVKRFAHRQPVIVRPNVFPRFLRAWTKNAPLAIRLCQCFGGCCKANVFRFAEQKQRCKRLQGSKFWRKRTAYLPAIGKAPRMMPMSITVGWEPPGARSPVLANGLLRLRRYCDDQNSV